MENCLFCKIAAGIIPSSKVYEDEKVLAFNDIDPQAPTHFLVIPKEHMGFHVEPAISTKGYNELLFKMTFEFN